MLLSRIKGPRCYKDLQTIGNVRYNTFQETCAAMGLLNDDNEWHEAFRENESTAFPAQLRQIFVHIIVNCNIADVHRLWFEHWKPMSDDILIKRRSLTGIASLNLSEEDIYNYTLTGMSCFPLHVEHIKSNYYIFMKIYRIFYFIKIIKF